MLMWLDEQDTKELLAEYGIVAPRGALAGSAEAAELAARQLGGAVYVKALVPRSGRSGFGAVLRADGPADVPRAFREVTAAAGAAEARVEAACPADAEYYLALAVLPGEPGPAILVSAAGGTGIEERGQTAAQIRIDPLLGLQPFHVRLALSEAAVPAPVRPLLDDVLQKCYRAMLGYDALLVEVNPLAIADGRPVALDARMIVDDYAAFSHPHLALTRAHHRDEASLTGRMRNLGIDYVALGGRIGIVGLGAGLTMHLVDWIADQGGSPAFFFDATVAAVRDHAAMFDRQTPQAFTRSLAAGLRLALPGADVLLANFTSGGTPVDSLTFGLLAALEEIDWRGPVILHTAGNREAAARQVPLPPQVSRADCLGDAVRAAVAAMDGTR